MRRDHRLLWLWLLLSVHLGQTEGEADNDGSEYVATMLGLDAAMGGASDSLGKKFSSVGDGNCIFWHLKAPVAIFIAFFFLKISLPVALFSSSY